MNTPEYRSQRGMPVAWVKGLRIRGVLISVPHPRVDEGVDEVDDQRDDDDGQGEDRDDSLNGDVVALVQVADQLGADPRPVERLLGQDGSSQEDRELEARHR